MIPRLLSMLKKKDCMKPLKNTIVINSAPQKNRMTILFTKSLQKNA